MFAVVDLSDERNRRFEKYRKHPFTVKRCDVFGCAPFFTVEGHGRYSDFGELGRIISRIGTAIFKDGNVPEGLEKCVYSPTVLPLRMLVKSVSEYFREQSTTGRNRKICVVDEKAYAAKEVTELSRYARFVRVVTGRRDTYSAAEQEAFKSFGAVITAGENRNLVCGCDCVIALSDRSFNPSSAELSLVYSKTAACDNVFAVKECSTLPEISDKAPAGIDRFEFYCALFETCGLRINEIPVFNDAKSILNKEFA